MAEESHRRIPSLDGLRAISIAFVLFGHLSHTTGFPMVGRVGFLASFGVRVFFVISGFLITSLLISEERRTGTISLQQFYLRRTVRIFPPFYAYVAVIAAIGALGLVDLQQYDVLAALTYTSNYHHQRSWYLGHAWSLAVEEQFYLLWPFLVKWLTTTRAARAAWGAVVLAPLIRYVLLVHFPPFRPGIGETFPTVADAIATGCLLACYRARLDGMPRLQAFLRGPLFLLVPALALLVATAPSARADFLLGQTVTNIGIAALVYRVIQYPHTALGRALNWRPVVFVGVLSYSLYLWQQVFLAPAATAWPGRFPANILLAVVAALLAHYLIERPALRLRGWIQRTPPPGLAPTP